MILEALHGHPAGQQGGADVGIPRQRLRLVIVIEVERAGAEFRHQRGNFLGRLAVTHQQTGAVSQMLQVGIQHPQRVQDEGDTAVGPGQRIQDVGVQHKGAVHPAVALEGVIEGRMIVRTQVAAEPDQGGVRIGGGGGAAGGGGVRHGRGVSVK